jgi:hypothetical protein
MKKIEMPTFIKNYLLTVYESSRLEHPKAHVSEVLPCLTHSFMRRISKIKSEYWKQIWIGGKGWETEILGFAVRDWKQLSFGTYNNPERSGIMPNLIGTLDAIYDASKDEGYGYVIGIECKWTRWNPDEEKATSHYENQCVMYGKMTGLPMLLIVRSYCPKFKTDFFITTEKDYKPPSFFLEKDKRGLRLLDAVRKYQAEVNIFDNKFETSELFQFAPENPPTPVEDWECSYCEYSVLGCMTAKEKGKEYASANLDKRKDKWKTRLVKALETGVLDEEV